MYGTGFLETEYCLDSTESPPTASISRRQPSRARPEPRARGEDRHLLEVVVGSAVQGAVDLLDVAGGPDRPLAVGRVGADVLPRHAAGGRGRRATGPGASARSAGAPFVSLVPDGLHSPYRCP